MNHHKEAKGLTFWRGSEVSQISETLRIQLGPEFPVPETQSPQPSRFRFLGLRVPPDEVQPERCRFQSRNPEALDPKP